MTDIEKAILTNQMAIMTAIAAIHINLEGYTKMIPRQHDNVAKENINHAMQHTHYLLMREASGKGGLKGGVGSGS